MKFGKMIVVFGVVVLAAATAVAGDFDWLKQLSVQAEKDPSGFKAQLATRFKINGTEVNAVVGNVGSHADAYMVLRLQEMSHQPRERVVEEYRKHKGGGWGEMAKNLGIKPGSAEFHELKRGHDLDRDDDHHRKHGHGHDRDDDQGDEHERGHGHGRGHDE
jgi:hypothetical protein